MNENTSATLWVVATPIGNLADISQRALDILESVDLVAAEDTRHTGKLLNLLGLSARLQALHEHNEQKAVPGLIEKLRAGISVALVCDAGTPLVNDPGFQLVSAAHDAGIKVSPVPGPSAFLAALSVSGLPLNQFTYLGFPPPKTNARQTWLAKYRDWPTTLVIYESKHRIVDCLADVATVLGGDRRLSLARELTKKFEEVMRGTVSEISSYLENNAARQKGEFVLVLDAAAEKAAHTLDSTSLKLVEELSPYLSPAQISRVLTKVTGVPRKQVYNHLVAANKRNAAASDTNPLREK